MLPSWDTRVLARLAVVFLIIILLGLTPRPHQLTRLFWEVQSDISAGNPQGAATRLYQISEYLPWRKHLLEQAGLYAWQSGEVDQALAYLEKCVLAGCLSTEGQFALADAHYQNGNLSKAIQLWNDLLRQEGPSPELYQRLYEAHRSIGDFPAAIQYLESLCEMQPSDAALLYQLGLLIATQHPENSLAHLRRAAEIDPSLASSVWLLVDGIRSAQRVEDTAYSLLEAGRILASLDEWELATEAFRRATLARPYYAEAWAFLGEARQHHGQPQGKSTKAGLPELQKAIALDDSSIAAHTFLGMYWKRNGKFDSALQSFHKAVELEPHNPALWVEIGSTQALLGDLQAALQAFQLAVELEPQQLLYWKFLVMFSVQHDFQVEEVGLPAASRAVIEDPRDPEALTLMGQVLFALGDYPQSEKFLQRALQIQHDFAPAHLYLGMIYLARNERGKAWDEFNLARLLAENTPLADQAQRLLDIHFP